MSQNLFNILQNVPFVDVENNNEENILDGREQNDMGPHVNVVGHMVITIKFNSITKITTNYIFHAQN